MSRRFEITLGNGRKRYIMGRTVKIADEIAERLVYCLRTKSIKAFRRLEKTELQGVKCRATTPDQVIKL